MGNQQSSPLHSAAAHDDAARVDNLLRQHPNAANEQDKDGWTPLHFAAYGGALEASQVLFLHGADAEPKDKANRTPLHLAALQGHATLASLLISRGASVDAADENLLTPLHKAAIRGHTELAERLLRLGANLHAAAKDGTQAIHLGAWKGHLELTRLLLTRGADANAVTNNKRTPLHEAAESGLADVVKLLLVAGADPHARDQEGEIPASLAAHAAHPEVAQLIAGGSGAGGQAGGAPSAPPLPATGGPVKYPEIFQGSAAQAQPAKEAAANADFWGGQLGEQDKEKAGNAAFWGAALGDEPPRAAGRQAAPVSEEVASNKRFWEERLAGRPTRTPAPQQDWDARAQAASAAFDHQMGRVGAGAGPQRHEQPAPPNPAQAAQELLRQAQGFWNKLQGGGRPQGPGQEAARRQQEAAARQRAAQEINADWGGGSGGGGGGRKEWEGVPSQQLHDLRPFEPEAPPLPESAQQSVQDLETARRRLAQLELELDQHQGLVRGRDNKEAEAVRAREARIREQEAEIARMKQRVSASLPRERTGGHDTASHAPSEYLCPITQEVMRDPVIAGDGYTYERAAIERWLETHNSSPMTGGILRKTALTPNNALKSAIAHAS